MKKIEAYESKDFNVFKTEDECIAHEISLKLFEHLTKGGKFAALDHGIILTICHIIANDRVRVNGILRGDNFN